MRRKMAAGNWKMNGDSQTLAGLSDLPQGEDVDVVICPPLTLLAATAAAVTPLGFAAGGQTCHAATSGAHTGDVSAEMLKAAGAAYVIVGHSERRADHGETDADVADMARAAARAGLVPIICLGETLDQRKAGQTLEVITRQLAGSVPADVAEVVIAYEPIWAIGTGEVATLEQIAEVHAHLRAELGARGEETRILYGGSVKPGNAAEIFDVANVDGALVGGASLSAQDFGPIVTAAASA